MWGVAAARSIPAEPVRAYHSAPLLLRSSRPASSPVNANGNSNGASLAANTAAQATIQDILTKVRRRDPEQREFLQAVEEVLDCLEPVLAKHPDYASVIERMCEPERLIVFRVPWIDDAGDMQINRGFRVQACGLGAGAANPSSCRPSSNPLRCGVVSFGC